MPSTKPRKILVAGATGYIGGRLVPRLIEAGYSVRCMARHPERLEQRWPDVELEYGDALEPNSLEGSLQGIDVAYYLIHSMAGGEAGFEERDQQAARNFTQAAKKAGVSQIIYLGGLGQTSAELSPHLKSRQEVGQILRESGIPVTEFRAAIIVGSGSLSFEIIRYLTERLPIMICPRWLSSKVQPISIRDILAYLLAALENPESRGKIIEIGGADILTYGEMLKQYAAVRGLRRFLIHVPVLTPRLSSYWLDLVTPIPASITRPLIEGLRNDVVCRDPQARKLFSINPMPYKEAVALALNRVESENVETTWFDAHASLGPGTSAPKSLEITEGMVMEHYKEAIAAAPSAVYRVVTSIGGTRGWYSFNFLWRLRGFIDRLFGGMGLRRGRRHPEELKLGDAVDFWRVEALRPNALLRLRAEMKLPGKAWLQFEMAESESQSTELIQTAFFEPKGLFGWLYWYASYPAHYFLFPSLIRAIKQRAESPDKL